MIVQPNYTPYPANFPVVSKIGFSGSVDTGVSRSSEQGFPSQERYAGTNPTIVNLEFRMTLSEFKSWSWWVQHNAVTQWVNIDLPSPNGMKAVGPDAPLTTQVVRFGAFTMTPLGDDYFQVNSTVQLLPTGVGVGLPGVGGGVVTPSPSSSDWIIGGEPYNPSTDWYIAGEPATPSVDTITAGTPATAI